jgi:hypothetical protein
MKFPALYLAGALIAAAIPLSASAAPVAADQGSAVSGRQATSATTPTCPPGYYWEPDGYARHGKFRLAHCAPRY